MEHATNGVQQKARVEEHSYLSSRSRESEIYCMSDQRSSICVELMSAGYSAIEMPPLEGITPRVCRCLSPRAGVSQCVPSWQYNCFQLIPCVCSNMDKAFIEGILVPAMSQERRDRAAEQPWFTSTLPGRSARSLVACSFGIAEQAATSEGTASIDA